MTSQPIGDQQLDEIETAITAYQQHPAIGFACCSAHPAADAAAALLAEVRRLRASFTDLAARWEQLAEQGDTSIGHFEGPAAAMLDAEVAERGNTYRQAAADARSVLANGGVPADLLTGDERRAAASTP